MDAGDSDAYHRWCASQGSHTLCEDFDDGFPGQLSLMTSSGPRISADTSIYASPPRSMRSSTSAIPDAGDESTALGFYQSSTPGAKFRVGADFYVGSDCFADGDHDYLTVARVDYRADLYGLGFYVSPSQSSTGTILSPGIYEVTYDTDGGESRELTSGYDGTLPLDQWLTLSFWADLNGNADNNTSGNGGGFSAGSATQPPDPEGGGLFGPASAPTDPPTLYVGADVMN